MSRIILCIYTIVSLVLEAKSEVVYPQDGYAVTPQGKGSNWLLILNPANDQDENGRTVCYEVEDNGSLKKLWTLPWYETRGYVYLHQDGRSVLRVHKIENVVPVVKKDYLSKVAISFYSDGRLVNSVNVDSIIQDMDYIYWSDDYVDTVRAVRSSLHFTMEEMGFQLYSNKLKEDIEKDSIFRVSVVDGYDLFFTSKGKLISKVTSPEKILDK